MRFLLALVYERSDDVYRISVQVSKHEILSLHVDQNAGDPLYVAGGQPKSVDPDLVDATTTPFAQDGYKFAFSNTLSSFLEITNVVCVECELVGVCVIIISKHTLAEYFHAGVTEDPTKLFLGIADIIFMHMKLRYQTCWTRIR